LRVDVCQKALFRAPLAYNHLFARHAQRHWGQQMPGKAVGEPFLSLAVDKPLPAVLAPVVALKQSFRGGVLPTAKRL
jgi:hypothetical protein